MELEFVNKKFLFESIKELKINLANLKNLREIFQTTKN